MPCSQRSIGEEEPAGETASNLGARIRPDGLGWNLKDVRESFLCGAGTWNLDWQSE